MTNESKALQYDELIRESDRLQRINSKLKSEYPINVPDNIQREIDTNKGKLDMLVRRLEDLMR